MSKQVFSAKRPDFDPLLKRITDYVTSFDVSQSKLAMETARYCLMDSIGTAFMALKYPACTKMLGPVVPGAQMTDGAKVPGTSYRLDPVQAAFNFGAMIRWLDFNDTWLAAEWGHPSDNLGGILMVADYVSRRNLNNGKSPLTMKDVLEGMIKAHEIQGVLALQNSFNRVGLDHVMLVRIATAPVVSKMLGNTDEQTLNVVSHTWIDGSSLRTYRHAPNTGSRKSWAAGDATARAVRLALIGGTGEMGYPAALSVPVWGFQDVLFKGKELQMERDFSTYVMENVLFKISFPAEFHAQTAVEAGVKLHPSVVGRIDDVDRIVIETQESGQRIINKTGKLDNPADRDHCIQYMVAISLIKGDLTAEDYEDVVANDVRVDALRDKMEVKEVQKYTKDYMDPSKRYIGNAVQVFFKDGTSTERVEINYPIGHRLRREEGIPVLCDKFTRNLAGHLSAYRCSKIEEICADQNVLESMAVNEFVDLLHMG